MRCLHDDIFSHFDRTPTCGRQMDGETDRTIAYTRAALGHISQGRIVQGRGGVGIIDTLITNIPKTFYIYVV